MKKKIFVLGFLIVLSICLELFLRMYFGFCDTVLVREDSEFEYIAQANQKRFRFRNHAIYNSFSMRSEEVDTSSIKILGFGDSIINGGVLTDQDSLATTILSDTLSKIYGTKIQFLNISAGSWGPDNCYAYLNKYGDFGAKSIFLFFSSHDAYDNMNFEKVVDNHSNFKSRQYSFAQYELVNRYLVNTIKRKLKKKRTQSDNLGINKKKDNALFNTGFSSFLDYSKSKNIPVTIYLHADTKELKLESYNEQGQEIIKFANDNDIPIILDLENGLKLSDFRDYIHLNSNGQRKLANTITHYLKNNHY